MDANHIQPIIEQARKLTTDELKQLIEQAADLLEKREGGTEIPDYVAMIGSGKGAYASPEEADRFIREERDQWER